MFVPKLRFKREDGSDYPEWEERPLGELVSDNLDPIPTPKQGYRRVGIYCHAKGTFQEDVPGENVLSVDTMYRIHRDNLIVNITFAWEHAVAIVKPEDDGLLVSHRFPEYSFNEGQVPGFFKYLILRSYFKNKLSLASPGGAGRNRVLNKVQFKQIPVLVPCTEEQQKIADFLSTVDEVIAQSEAEVSNLEQQKKAAMQKIFSQEVRFKRDDGSDYGEWERDIISNICSIKTGESNSQDQSKNGKYPFYIRSERPVRSNRFLYDCEAVLTIGDGNIGKVFHYVNGKFDIHQRVYMMHEFQNVIAKYFYYYFSMFFYKRAMRLNAKGTVNSVRREMIADMPVSIPSLEEQKKIADFLSAYDEAISYAKQELELWKKIKKGLLQQMFV